MFPLFFMKKEIKLKFEHHCLRCSKNFKSKKENPKSCAKCKSRSWKTPKKPLKEKWIKGSDGKSKRITLEEYVKIETKKRELEKKISKDILKSYKIKDSTFVKFGSAPSSFTPNL